MNLIEEPGLAEVVGEAVLVAELPARRERLHGAEHEALLAHVVAQHRRCAHADPMAVAHPPAPVHLLRHEVELREELIASGHHAPGVEAVHLALVLALLAPHVDPARQPRAVARGIRAAHDCHALLRRNRHDGLHAQGLEVALHIEALGKQLLEVMLMTRDKGDGHADEHVDLLLHELAVVEQREVRDRV